MGIVSSPPASERDTPCLARKRGEQASLLSSVLALGMAFDACAQDRPPAATPKGSTATQPADGADLAHVPVGMASLDELEIVMRVVNHRSPVRVEYSCLSVKHARALGDYVL